MVVLTLTLTWWIRNWLKLFLSTIAKARSFVQYCVSLSKDKIFNWSYRIVENVWQCNKLNINDLFLELPPPKFGVHCCEQVVAAIPASAWNIHSLQVTKCKYEYMFTTEQPSDVFVNKVFATKIIYFKGTDQRDFRLPVFFIIQASLGYWSMGLNIFNFG